MLDFLNLFLVPIISLSIYLRRADKKVAADFELLRLYSYFTIALCIGCFIVMELLEFLVGLGAKPSSQFYTIVATVLAFFMPYLFEIYQKYFDVRCEIDGKDESTKEIK